MEITLSDIVKPNCNKKICCLECNKFCKKNNCIKHSLSCSDCFYQPYDLTSIEIQKSIETNKKIVFINNINK